MEVKELKDALSVFNPSGAITVAVPALGKPHELREIRLVGHLDHPGEVKSDPDHPGALDVVCDHWDDPPRDAGPSHAIGDLLKALEPYPDGMHVRVAVPVQHDSVSHRMLDIVMLGHAVGTAKGTPGVQMICENWDNPYQVVKEFPHVVEARQREYEQRAASVPPGEALPDTVGV